MTKQEKVARVIRIITVPPLLITMLLIILNVLTNDIFYNKWYLFCMILFLGIFPALAYPMQKILPKFKESGRDGQRRLAFIFSVIGYFLAVIFGYSLGVGKELQLICNTYLISVILLTICNKLLHIRASGHACSVTGPLIFLPYFAGWKYIPIAIVIGATVVWSSLLLKRHTKRDLLVGAIVCVAAFVLALCMKMAAI